MNSDGSCAVWIRTSSLKIYYFSLEYLKQDKQVNYYNYYNLMPKRSDIKQHCARAVKNSLKR